MYVHVITFMQKF